MKLSKVEAGGSDEIRTNETALAIKCFISVNLKVREYLFENKCYILGFAYYIIIYIVYLQINKMLLLMK